MIPVTALRLENTLLVICKVLGLFVNPLTSDYKYSLLKTENLLQHFQRQLSKKRKIFSEFFFFFFFAFCEFIFKFEHFQTKMTLTADVFLNLRSPKNVVR